MAGFLVCLYRIFPRPYSVVGRGGLRDVGSGVPEFLDLPAEEGQQLWAVSVAEGGILGPDTIARARDNRISSCKLATLEKIASALNVDVNELFTYKKSN